MARYTKLISGTAIAVGLVAAPLLVGTAMAQTTGMTAPGAAGQTQGQMMPGQNGGMANQNGQGGMQATPPDGMSAMNVSPTTVAKAGKAMHNVLQINKSYSAKLSGATDPAAKSAIVAEAKQKAMSAITSQGLTVGQYNQVLASAEQNPQLRSELLSSAGVTAN